jgi:hypothetical protein
MVIVRCKIPSGIWVAVGLDFHLMIWSNLTAVPRLNSTFLTAICQGTSFLWSKLRRIQRYGRLRYAIPLSALAQRLLTCIFLLQGFVDIALICSFTRMSKALGFLKAKKPEEIKTDTVAQVTCRPVLSVLL